jgi:hypothetical protein
MWIGKGTFFLQREIKPSCELPSFFSDLFEFFQFGNGQAYYELADRHSLSPEEKKNIIDAWKATVDVQQHFNDISLRIRGLFVTLIIALAAAIGFLAEKNLRITVADITVHYAIVIPIIGIVGTLLFYFMDRYWYHRLLVGSVNHGESIERRHRFEIPEIGLTAAIGATSPIKLTRRLSKWLAKLVVTDDEYLKGGLVHSTAKIELIYKPVVYLLLSVFLVMLLGGGVLVHGSTIIEVGAEKIKSMQFEKSSIHTAPPPSVK